jgi:bidirectional [NiFe] hydrogenase diaphorase subunit
VPTVTIDGCKVRVKKDATILDAARKAGIWIPTLCYHPSVSTDASCRLCMVELDRGDWRQLVTACNYPVRRDIVVYANSERAQQARRGVMELLLARAPDSEELKALAERMGVYETRYPKVTESQRNCILCGLCVQVCEEIIGKAAIGFAGRGVDKAVAAAFRGLYRMRGVCCNMSGWNYQSKIPRRRTGNRNFALQIAGKDACLPGMRGAYSQRTGK